MKRMNLYSLTLQYRAPDHIRATTTYLARGRSLAEAKRFARAKFNTVNPDSKLTRITESTEELRTQIGLRYSR